MQSLGSHTMEDAGRYTEATAFGLAVLRLLKIDISPSTTPITIFQEIVKTDKIAATYTPNQIVHMKATSAIDERRRNLFRIVDAVMVASYMEASPYLPLITCAIFNYCLENGVVCEESASKYNFSHYFHILLSIQLTSISVCLHRQLFSLFTATSKSFLRPTSKKEGNGQTLQRRLWIKTRPSLVVSYYL